MKKDHIYIVTMHRWGDSESHSYFLCAHTKKHAALKAGDDEHDYRGGKYYPLVLEVPLLTKPGGRDIKYKVIRDLPEIHPLSGLSMPEHHVKQYLGGGDDK